MSSYSCCSLSAKELRQLASLVNLLKIVAEESRLKILWVLQKDKHCVCELMRHLAMSQSLISHHLKDLKDAVLVIDERQGVRVYYSLTEKGKDVTNLIFQIPKEVRKK